MSSLTFQACVSPNWGFHLHEHQTWELLVLTTGHCWHTVADVRTLAKAPVAFLVAPRVVHSFATDGFLPNGEVCTSRMVWFPGELGHLPIPDAEPLNVLRRRVALRGFGPAVLAADAHLAAAAQATPATAAALVLVALAGLLEAGMEPMASLGPIHRQGGVSERLAAIEAWIDQHLGHPVTLAGAADALGLSANGINGILKRERGQTFQERIAALRVERLQELLVRNPGTEVATLAGQCGFGSASACQRRFRQLVGEAPEAWRKRQVPKPDPWERR